MAAPEVFVGLRPTLFGVAYRMLGSATDAEDVLQEAFLRWQAQPDEKVQSARAFLTTVVVRLCIDESRSARARRETYVGQWLPEPVTTSDPDPSAAAELADSLSLAFLVILEELTPAERAALILRDVFSYSYEDISATLGRSQPACRQLVARAHRQIGERRHRFDSDRRRGDELARRFVGACIGGDPEELFTLLAPDVVVWSDGGGKAKAAPRPVVGAAKAARFLVTIAKSGQQSTTVRYLQLNGQPGIVLEEDGRPTTAVVLDIIGQAICGVRIVVNPDKLNGIRADRGTAPFRPVRLSPPGAGSR